MPTKLDDLALERNLAPGTVLELEYSLLVTNKYLVANWLNGIEQRLNAEYPMWRYEAYTLDLDNKRITFRMRLGDYRLDGDGNILVRDPSTGEYQLKYLVNPQIQTANGVLGIVSGALIVVGLAWAIPQSVKIIAVVNSKDLTPEQKTEILSKDSVGSEVAKAGTGVLTIILGVIAAWTFFRGK